MEYILSYDLGTGGLKTGLYRLDGSSVGFDFEPYQTYYPQADWHEQRPQDWWKAVCVSTNRIIQSSQIDPREIAAVSSSGHSLVVAPIDQMGNLLLESVPIWSDRRAKQEAHAYFQKINYEDWYLITGNGDPPETYSVFKLMWLKRNDPDLYSRTSLVLGSKDYIHYLLTGVTAIDYSYASGSGVFDLRQWKYSEAFITAAGIKRDLFLTPVDSSQVIGSILPEAASQCGLFPGTQVICGGVDNSCMAFGTTGNRANQLYTSLGSSAWIAVTKDIPIVEPKSLPFVFAHVQKGSYTTGVSIFSAASCYRWAREVFCADIIEDPYPQMDQIAASAPVGSNGVLFNPTLAGGSSQEPGQELLGGFFGLTLSTSRSDLLRAVLEGVALSLRCYCLPVLEQTANCTEPMILCGGGAKSDLWMQIIADVFNRRIDRINVDQDAASLGAAALAAYGSGMWKDYSTLDQVHHIQKSFFPQEENCKRYERIAENFMRWVGPLAEIHRQMMVVG